MNEIERQLASINLAHQNETRLTDQQNREAASKAGQHFWGSVKDIAKGILRGNTTDFLNYAQEATDKSAIGTAMKLAEIGSKQISKAIGKKEDPENPTPVEQRPIGDVVLEKITGMKKGSSGAEEVGSMLSVGGLSKAMIVAAAKVGRPQLFKKANELVDQGVSNAELFDKTGTYADRDAQLKAFLSDKDARINAGAYSDLATGTQKEVPLGQLLDHPSLYEAYPDLKNVLISRNQREGLGGSYNPQGDYIMTNTNNPTETKSILLHEVQHAIQRREGYTGGTNVRAQLAFKPESVQEKIKAARESDDPSVIRAANRMKDTLNFKIKEAETKYMNKEGEQEARFTQFTEDMSDVEGNTFLNKVIKSGDTPQTWDTAPMPTKSVITGK